MIIHLKYSDINVYVTGTGLPVWLFLHGFMGTHRDYLQVAQHLPGTVISPDLLGHGATQATCEQSFSMAAQVEVLHTIVARVVKTTAPINLVGYSMGARLAIGYAATYPATVARLIVEGGRPGMATADERLARQTHDQELANRLLTNGIEDFVNYWENLPLFNSQQLLPMTTRSAVRESRLRQSAAGLARSLVEMGAGQQPNYWPALSAFNFETLLITGEMDAKFTAINREMSHFLPAGRHQIVTAVGHNVHLEALDQYLELLLDGGNADATH